MDVEKYTVDLPVLYYGINYGRTISISFTEAKIRPYKMGRVMELPKAITIRFPSIDIDFKGISVKEDEAIIFTFSTAKKDVGQVRVLKYMLRRFVGLDLK